jgi:UTP--glucose-1-phosphate uridylyltransferase
MKPVTKAVIPVAGLGTRFLPATKAQPKEMLTVIDKPVIQYVVEEAIASGIRDIVLITGQNKRAIEDHFDRNFELESRLKEQGKLGTLHEVKEITKLANFIYIRQKEPRGDGHAILEAESLLRGEPFAVMTGDDIIDSPKPTLGELIKIYQEFGAPVVAACPVPKKEISHFGVIGGTKIRPNLYKLNVVVEKPAVSRAPSNLAIVVRYILNDGCLDELKKIKLKPGQELRTADGFAQYIKKKAGYGYIINGTWYDCGSKLGLLQANTAFGLRHKDLKNDYKRYLKKLL